VWMRFLRWSSIRRFARQVGISCGCRAPVLEGDLGQRKEWRLNVPWFARSKEYRGDSMPQSLMLFISQSIQDFRSQTSQYNPARFSDTPR